LQRARELRATLGPSARSLVNEAAPWQTYVVERVREMHSYLRGAGRFDPWRLDALVRPEGGTGRYYVDALDDVHRLSRAFPNEAVLVAVSVELPHVRDIERYPTTTSEESAAG
jgi:hypothetical protein